jgi:ubiquitin-protein ligase
MKKTWKQRLKKEYSKLDKKTNALLDFIEGGHGDFDSKGEIDRDLLMAQYSSMVTYLNILEIRMKMLGLLKSETAETKEGF